MNPVDLTYSADLLFSFSASFVADLGWIGLGCFFARRFHSDAALLVVLLVFFAILVHAGVSSSQPAVYLPAAVVDIVLKGVLAAAVSRRVGFQDWGPYVLFASLLGMLILLIPVVGMERSGRYLAMGRYDIHEAWQWRAWLSAHLRVGCQYAAIFALFRSLSRLAASNNPLART